MGLFDWVKKKPTAGALAELEVEYDKEELAGLNLKQVMDGHTAWKDKLQKVLGGAGTEQIDISVVSQDNQCTLGKWIHEEGKHFYGGLPEYAALREAHADFHLSVGEVLIKHRDGNQDHARQLFDTRFRKASNRNKVELVRLHTAAKRRLQN